MARATEFIQESGIGNFHQDVTQYHYPSSVHDKHKHKNPKAAASSEMFLSFFAILFFGLIFSIVQFCKEYYSWRNMMTNLKQRYHRQSRQLLCNVKIKKSKVIIVKSIKA